MTKARELLTTIPFCGFYESLYSSEIDHTEEMEIENFLEHEQEQPEPLRISGPEYGDILYFKATNYGTIHNAIAAKYAREFNALVSEAIGFPLRLRFESMTSPREYNFTTDRIFTFIPASVVRKLFAMSKRDGHATLTKAIKKNFTSRDGFSSFYSNRLEVWLEKPVTEWDHNEIGTLLVACHTLSPDYTDEWDMSLFYSMVDCDGLYHEWSDGVDWERVETELKELRADKETEMRELNPDYEPPYRCPLTPDMFTGKRDCDLH